MEDGKREVGEEIFNAFSYIKWQLILNALPRYYVNL